MPSEYDGTKIIETLAGPKRYTELLPDLALGLERTMKRLSRNDPSHLCFSFGSILGLHEEAFRGIVAWAGQPRTVSVQIREHEAPPFYQVRDLLKDFADTLEMRVTEALKSPKPSLNQLAEVFAFCEGRFNYIHPFEDFNGRISRVLLWILVIRFDLPHTARLAAVEDAEIEEWREALSAFDRSDRAPLAAHWMRRIEEAPAARGIGIAPDGS